MKSGLYLLLTFLFITFSIIPVIAQEESDDSPLFLIHEDRVFPHKIDQYEKAIANFRDLLRNNNVDEMSFTVVQTTYFNFSAVIPVNDYNGLANHFAMSDEMVKKVGMENFQNALAQFEGCYNSHKNYLLKMRKDLSHKATYGLDPDEGLNYRHFDYFYIIPGKEQEAVEVFKEWKAIYEKHNIEWGYRIYEGELGLDSPMFMMVKPFKDRPDWVNKAEEIGNILGDDQTMIQGKITDLMIKFEHYNGRMRPDLAHTIE